MAGASCPVYMRAPAEAGKDTFPASTGTPWDLLPFCLGWSHQRERERWRASGCLERQGVRFLTPSYTDFILRCQRCRRRPGLLSHPGANVGLSADICLPLTQIWPAGPRPQPYWLWGICHLLPGTCVSFLLISSGPAILLRCIISHFGGKKNRLHLKELTAVCFLALPATSDKWVTQAFHVPSGALPAKESLAIPPAWRLGPWWIVSKSSLRLFFNI